MTVDDLLGQRVALPIRRISAPGAFLALDDDPDGDTILLPNPELTRAMREGDELTVFVHLDSEERPVATLREPLLLLGQVAFLRVTATTQIGAFVDWGLGKELLVPFAEQSREVFVGERHPIGLYLDKSMRLAGTMFVGDLLDGDRRRLELDEWIPGEAWRNDPDIGLFVILEKSYVGLVPASEPHRLSRGEAASFRVANLLPDGKVVLSLRQHAFAELEADAAMILKVLSRPDAPALGDRSHPDDIREVFGISKKAFKRAVGRLLKERQITIAADGTIVAAK